MSAEEKLSRRDGIDLGRTLLQRRCIYGVGLSQEDISKWWGVSRQRIEQIENKALRKIRNRYRFSGDVLGIKLWDELMTELFDRRSPATKRVRE